MQSCVDKLWGMVYIREKTDFFPPILLVYSEANEELVMFDYIMLTELFVCFALST